MLWSLADPSPGQAHNGGGAWGSRNHFFTMTCNPCCDT